MGKIKNLTGQKFGKLTVLEDTGKRKNRQVVWLCECDCINKTKIEVVGQSLRTGHTQSCGCLVKKQGRNKKDLVGQVFGNLTVIKDSGLRKNRKVIWECQCNCINQTTVYKQKFELENLQYPNCGCINRINPNLIKDLSNQVFGELTALNYTKERDKYGRVIWNCKCSCGNIVKINSNSLLTGNTKSCGCIRDKKFTGEEEISKILTDNNISFKRQVIFSELKSIKQNALRFDFALLDKENNIYRLIEFNGIQHYQPIEYFGGEQSFKIQQQNDKLKKEYCKANSLDLVIIPYYLKDGILLQDLLGDEYLD